MKVIFFDGVCNLCEGSVQFVIKIDKQAIFRFASLQSAYAEEKLATFGKSNQDLDSFILFDEDKILNKSSAVLQVLRLIGGWWYLTQVFWIIPKVLRDAIYSWIAKHRYTWFGKKESCMMPTPELKSRFLD